MPKKTGPKNDKRSTPKRVGGGAGNRTGRGRGRGGAPKGGGRNIKR